jgi:hypothetical protein
MVVNDQDQINDSTETTALDRLVAQVSAEPEEAKTVAVDPDDTDAVEEAAARKALADEEAAANATTEVKVPEKTEGKTTESVVEQKTTEKPGPMIPKARLDEVIADREKATAAAAYWKGIADERARAAQADANPAEAKLTPQQQLEAIEARRDALAAQVDDGKLLMSDFVKEDRKLKAEEEGVRDTLRKPADTQAPKRGSDLYLEERTAKLEQDHPYVAELSSDDLAYLTRKAVAELANEGIKLPAGDLEPADQLVLRTKIAALSDRFGPALTGKELKKPGAATDGKPAMSKEARQREEKLAAAASAPPDLTAAGRSTSPTSDYSEAQILAMSEEQIEALPQSVRDKIMGRMNS